MLSVSPGTRLRALSHVSGGEQVQVEAIAFDAVRRLMRCSVLPLLVVPLLACGTLRQPRPSEQVVVLDVRNHSFFDVNVFALPSPASGTRVRLGNVTGFSTAELRVPASALRQGQSLVLYLHAIGSNRSWTSPEVLVSSGVRPCLDIHSNLAGDLGMSVLYSRIAADSGNGHCGAP